jgi:hypothetical protein
MVTTTTGIATSYIQFTRASNATVTNNVGNIAWAGHNLLTNSESFDAAAWTKVGVTVTAANGAVAPNGTTTADTITLGAGTAVKVVYQTIASTDAQCAIGFYVKIASGTVRYVQLLQNIDVQSYANFDITGNAVGTKGTNTPASAITSVGANWYYITATFSGAGSGAWIQVVDGTSSSYSPSTSATGTFHLWGASLYRSDLGGMVFNPAQPAGFGTYYPTTPPNLLGYTQDFNNAYWLKYAVAVPATKYADPFGGTTANLLYPTLALAAALYKGGFPSVSKTHSYYVKSAGKSWVCIWKEDVTGGAAWFNLSTGLVGTVAAGYTASGPVLIGNGWYRCSVTSTSGFSQYTAISAVDADNSTTPIPNGTDGIYIWGAQLSDSASLDAYSPVYGAAVTSSAYYAPRLDYSPTTIQPLGILVEEQRTNIVLNSAAFDAASWTKTNLNTTGTPAWINAESAPDGTVTAEKLIANTVADRHIVTSADIAAGTYTWSVFMKAGGRPRGFISAYTPTDAYKVGTIFELSGAGSIVSQVAGSNSTITALSNSWYRCTVTTTLTSGTVFGGMQIGPNLGGGVVEATAGNNVDGIYVWGAQLEANASFATSYIPTGASTVTRSADVASVSTQAFPYSQGVGSLVVAVANMPTVNQTAMISGFNTSTYSNAIQFYKNNATNTGAGGNFTVLMFDGVDTSLSLATSANDGNQHKLGMAWNSSGVSGVADGGTVQSGTYRNAQPTQLEIGGINGSSCINGHIRQITYLPRRITNAELQTRTT